LARVGGGVKRIHKYVLTKSTEPQLVRTKSGATILAFGVRPAAAPQDGEQIVMWVEEDPDYPKSATEVVLVWTGHPVPTDTDPYSSFDWLYRATVQTDESGERTAWHVYVLTQVDSQGVSYD
jgi:hypothetical protein